VLGGDLQTLGRGYDSVEAVAACGAFQAVGQPTHFGEMAASHFHIDRGETIGQGRYEEHHQLAEIGVAAEVGIQRVGIARRKRHATSRPAVGRMGSGGGRRGHVAAERLSGGKRANRAKTLDRAQP